MSIMKKLLTVSVLILSLMIIGGCAGIRSKSYVHPNADFLAIKRVAVMPFLNLTDSPHAEQKVRDIFVTELLSLGYFDVLEFGEMKKVLKEMKIDKPDDIDAAMIKKLGKSLGVQAIIFGVVEEYNKSVSTGAGSFPEVAVNLRMVDTKTDIVIWMSSNSEGGGATVSFLGLGETPYISELTRKVIRQMVRSLMIQIPAEK